MTSPDKAKRLPVSKGWNDFDLNHPNEDIKKVVGSWKYIEVSLKILLCMNDEKYSLGKCPGQWYLRHAFCSPLCIATVRSYACGLGRRESSMRKGNRGYKVLKVSRPARMTKGHRTIYRGLLNEGISSSSQMRIG